MERPVITDEQAKNLTVDVNKLIVDFSKEQPFILSQLISQYQRLPKMAFIVYHLFKTNIKAEVPEVSRETVESLSSVIGVNEDKKKLQEDFTKEQPNLAALMIQGYEYVPGPALLVYFGLIQQIESKELAGLVQ